MMDQLGIKALRPGPSGNEKAPNHANYDESLGQSVSERSLTRSRLNDGQKVTTAKMWWDQRRPELVEMFSKYVYGRVPSRRTQSDVDCDHRRSRDDRLHAGHRQRSHRRSGQFIVIRRSRCAFT